MPSPEIDRRSCSPLDRTQIAHRSLVFGSQIIAVLLVVASLVGQRAELRSQRPGARQDDAFKSEILRVRLWDDPFRVLANLMKLWCRATQRRMRPDRKRNSLIEISHSSGSLPDKWSGPVQRPLPDKREETLQRSQRKD